MEENKLIEYINQSDIMCSFIEVGAGIPVASAFLDYEKGGGSKTVFEVKSPYSKAAQSFHYCDDNTRSVSFEFVRKILITEWENKFNTYRNYFKDLNSILVNSFQIGVDVCNHGWFAIRKNNFVVYFHVTLPQNIHKAEKLSLIREIGLQILTLAADYKDEKSVCDYRLISKYIDIICDDNQEPNLQFLLQRELPDSNPVLFTKHSIDRLENLSRVSDVLIVYKGSFNPLHDGHKEIMEISSNLYPGSISVYSISQNTFGKGFIPAQELIQRIPYICENTNYGVLLFSESLFKENIRVLRTRLGKEITLVFPMGWDTFDRLEDNFFDDLENIHLVVFDRGNNLESSTEQEINSNKIVFMEYDNFISSTQLRQE